MFARWSRVARVWPRSGRISCARHNYRNDNRRPERRSVGSFSVSGTWLDSGSLDPRHTCLGSNVSPALTIQNVPAGAQSLAISLTETTNPDQPLWVVANLNPASLTIQEGGLPTGAIVGAAFNGDKIVDGYSGPCITDGEIHEFVLVVYAVDQIIEFEPETQSLASSKLLLNAIQASAFNSAETRFFVQNP